MNKIEAYLDGVVLIDFWVGETDGPSVMGYKIRNFVFANALSLDLAELETSVLAFDLDGLETTFDVVEDAEVLVGLFN